MSSINRLVPGGRRDQLRQPPVLPGPHDHPGRDGRVPAARPVDHPGHRPAADARQPRGHRRDPGRGRRRGHVVARPRGRQRDAGELHLGRRSSARSPRAASSPSTAARPGDDHDDRDGQGRSTTSPNVVIDGGGKVTLDGGGARRILYMNTCDQALVWTTDRTARTRRTRRSRSRTSRSRRPLDGPRRRRTAAARSSCAAGGSRWSTRGFFGNRCASTGPDVGGAAIQVFSQYNGLPGLHREQHVRRVRCRGNTCSNGGAHLAASACRGRSSTACSPATARSAAAPTRQDRQPGGGNGGAIYNDGNEMTLRRGGHPHRGQHVQPRGRQRDLLRQQRPDAVRGDRRLASCSTTPATASRPTPGSSSWATRSRSRTRRSSSRSGGRERLERLERRRIGEGVPRRRRRRPAGPAGSA